ncbi:MULTISPECIES: AzlC family ABC transporter permease [unclassified Moraxella]|uniref:AzlC family ABC transporter permease n=1 Tax=unclassified Moraxella TaxID=2685852 RepID=UPI003AF660C5
MTTHPTIWQQAFKLSLPVAMGYIPAGLAFGVLWVAGGLPVWGAIFSSMLLYAGAAQYASIPLLASGTGLMTLASNTLAINLRHMFYGLPLLHELRALPVWVRCYCLFALTDETFSVLTTLEHEQRQTLFLPISLFNQSYWVIGTLFGVVIGAGLNQLVPHLDFALVCLFAILAYEQFRSLTQWYPIIIAVITFAVAMAFFGQWVLLSAIALSILLIIGHFWLQSSSLKSINKG